MGNNDTSDRYKHFDIVLEQHAENYSLVARVAKDRLKLFIGITAPPEPEPEPEPEPDNDQEQRPVSVEEIRECLAEKFDTNLFDEAVLQDIVTNFNTGKETEHRRIAKGRAAVKGRDGKLLLLVKPYDRKDPDTEVVDHRFIRHFDNVEPDTVIGRIYPPSDGDAGRDVYGQAIAAVPGKAATVKTDATIRQEEPKGASTFSRLVATTYGFVEIVRGVLRVSEELVLKGDIDFRIGDIDFVGRVKIQGNVMSGFNVVARDDVQINGDVDGGHVLSKAGSVFVKGNIVGEAEHEYHEAEIDEERAKAIVRGRGLGAKERYQVEAAQKITARMIVGSKVNAGGTIEVAKEVRGSLLRSRGVLWMPKGHFVNGEVYAVCGVEAKIFGTDTDAFVVIYLCSDVESSVEYAELTRQLDDHLAAEEMLALYLGPYAENPVTLQRLAGDHRNKLEKMLKKFERVKKSKALLEEQRDELLANAHYNSVLRANYHKFLYRSVRIIAGDDIFKAEHHLKGPGGVEYCRDERTFTVGDFSALECDFFDDH